MKMKIRIEGTEEIKRNLQQLMRATNRNIVQEALIAGAELVAEEARRLVPVDTGNLRDSIGISTETKGMNFARVQLKKGDQAVFVGPMQGKGLQHDGFYGHMIEFGTMHARPQPFMAPAFEAMGQKATYVVLEYIADEFERLAKG
ncbi:hypothetical protein LH128_05830 [Sphingomonas sp. LH128]|uniref:HK97-gp10 family putative phage morphogenesis protein n=1 Tax=Sphingomonas sp. LH128 TaxID=473781 RepID=UPI00027CA6DD|nr:HK97-gp10 family putative phage morphogenesis protein [Sphingomonas sp. LH128]EJU13994.1 hypothetical protein LH128_05830 [Sphingomonas sp. LH128]